MLQFFYFFSRQFYPIKTTRMGNKTQYRFFGLPIFEKRDFSAPVETRSAVDNFPISDLKNPADWLFSTFGYPSSSNIMVTEDQALTLSAVWSCVRVLSEPLAMLPLNVFTIDASRNRQIAYTDPLYFLLHNKPNPLMTSFVLRETMQLHVTLTGNAYCIIHRDQFANVTELELVRWPKEVWITKSDLDNRKYYSYRGKTYSDDEVLHIMGMSYDGLKGINPIQYARENMGTGVSLQQFGGTFFKNGARMSGVIEVPKALSDPAYNHLKDSFNQEHSGVQNVGKTHILEGGAKYVALNMSNEDAQFLLSRKFSIEEIARIFRVPLHMIGSLDKATNNNIEHQGIEFATYTMTPHVERWEQEMNSKLIMPSERGKKFAQFDMKGLLRGDSAGRAALFKEMFYAGAMTPNEIRESEGMNHYEGGDVKYIPVNLIPSNLSGKNIEAQIEASKTKTDPNPKP
jgi:phage portal protein, HK97 family